MFFFKATDSSKIEQTENLDDSKSAKISALLDLNSVSKKQNFNMSSFRISFVVYQNSILFDVNSARIQKERNNECSNIHGDQIVSNVRKLKKFYV